ncbi:MAG: BglII/BstYI family type II restriction endonuclease, partial [SAR324 cluster bacterium]|nr:BglII/BstYI family type II restriction endonuclease [SAR324 cluster bacterium]
MAPVELIPTEIHEWRHAASILAVDFPEEFKDLCDALLSFRLTEDQIKAPGGSESEIPKTFSNILRPLGWKESQLNAKLVVDDAEVSSDTHKIDYLKNRIA